jgi:hypothetical protein
MTRRRPLRPLTVCALALAASTLFGCSPAPTPTPSPTAAFASEEEAFAAAEETYRAYIDASNAVDLRDPATFESVSKHTVGEYRADEREQLSQMSAEGYTRSGSIVVREFAGVEWSRDVIRAHTCEDVSGVGLTDEAGNSVVSADRPDRYALDIWFRIDQGVPRISKTESVVDQECTEQ